MSSRPAFLLFPQSLQYPGCLFGFCTDAFLAFVFLVYAGIVLIWSIPLVVGSLLLWPHTHHTKGIGGGYYLKTLAIDAGRETGTPS